MTEEQTVTGAPPSTRRLVRETGIWPPRFAGLTRPASPPRWVLAALAGLISITAAVWLTIGSSRAPGFDPRLWPAVRLPKATDAQGGLVPAGVVMAVATLVASWARLQRGLPETGLRLRSAVAVGTLWALPTALTVPLLSRDAYSYAAVGRLAATGHDPYLVGPAALGRGPFLALVDPLWQHTPTPYGPVLVALLRVVADLGGGSVLITVLLLRALAVVATAAAVVLAVRAAPSTARAQVLVLTALNPVVLLHLVSGAHLDALLGAAAVGVVLLTLRGRWYSAVVLAGTAFLIKAPALVLVGFVLLYAVRRVPSGRRARTGAGLLAALAATGLASFLLLPDPFGWVHALDVPGRARNLAAPSAWLAGAVEGLSRLFAEPLPGSAALAVGRAVALAVGAALALRLLWRGTASPEPAEALRFVGWALIVVALSGPAVYGWYMTWGLFAAAIGSRPRERAVLLALSALTSLIGLPAMYTVPLGAQVVLWTTVAALWWWARPATGRGFHPSAAEPATP